MSWKKESLEGSVLGVLLSLLSVWLLGVPAEILLGGYALLLLLFSAYLTSSSREGMLLGLFAVIGEAVMDLIYWVSVERLMVSLVPYAVGFTLFVGRIGFFPIMGAIGGYLGQQYFAERTKPRLRAKKRVVL
jgi:hypothetical protein